MQLFIISVNVGIYSSEVVPKVVHIAADVLTDPISIVCFCTYQDLKGFLSETVILPSQFRNMV